MLCFCMCLENICFQFRSIEGDTSLTNVIAFLFKIRFLNNHPLFVILGLILQILHVAEFPMAKVLLEQGEAYVLYNVYIVIRPHSTPTQKLLERHWLRPLN